MSYDNQSKVSWTDIFFINAKKINHAATPSANVDVQCPMNEAIVDCCMSSNL